jgi:hypothetical protein
MFGVEEGFHAENISEMFGIRYEQGASLITPDRTNGVFRDHGSLSQETIGIWYKHMQTQEQIGAWNRHTRRSFILH